MEFGPHETGITLKPASARFIGTVQLVFVARSLVTFTPLSSFE